MFLSLNYKGKSLGVGNKLIQHFEVSGINFEYRFEVISDHLVNPYSSGRIQSSSVGIDLFEDSNPTFFIGDQAVAKLTTKDLERMKSDYLRYQKFCKAIDRCKTKGAGLVDMISARMIRKGREVLIDPEDRRFKSINEKVFYREEMLRNWISGGELWKLGRLRNLFSEGRFQQRRFRNT